ncbi:hypothetical protein MSG28_012846 [Choristoneura fumiferana]|uniref:Uncharacterized protein n=1 Tax=Choristoneura fumiferana TaxID=7141 RepID=A0ACC0JI55_CHOFU|nr:hypothetical protein MSG28_012846 [Choristoneura fumiferana]
MATEDFTTLSKLYHVVTDDLVSKALTDWFKEAMTFTHWKYVGETGKGDSYLSEVIRIKVFGKNKAGDTKHVQVVLKSIPRSVSRRLTFRSHDFFKNEIIFYETVLPALLKFQSSKNIPDPFLNYAKVFLLYCDGSNDIVCLEDASLESFGSAVRQEGINLEHCKLTFKVLAKFHALSFAMKDQEPEEFERISNAITEQYYDERIWDWYERIWKRFCSIAIDAVEKEYPNSIYLEKVKQFAVPDTYKACIKAVQTRKTGVISHGDCWTNNFLYKYEDGKPTDAKMIDFQLTRCATPVLDLVFSVYACTTQDMRLKYYDELLTYYYDVLSGQIKAYGSDPEKVYSRELFMEEGDAKLNIDDVWQMQNFKTKEGRLREANNIKHCVDYGYI